MLKSRWASWLLTLLRYGLCVVAILYLYFKVSWHDHLTLADAAGTQVRLLETRGDTFTVLRDGKPVEISIADVKKAGETGLPEINFGIHGIVSDLDVSTALLAILAFMPVPFFAAVRLVWMLRVQEVSLRLWDATKLTFAGNFFNFALPGTTGGDLFKAYYVTKYTHHKTEAVTTIFLDRVIGLLGLMIIATAMLGIAWKTVPWDAKYRNTLAGGLSMVWCGLLVGSIVIFSTRLRSVLRLGAIAERLPAGQHLLRVGRATVAMRRHKTLLAMSVGLTIALWLLVVCSAFLMSRALGMKGDAALYFICVPIGFLIASIPISPPQAFGVLEWAYIQFFGHDGLNSAAACVAFALAIRLIQLVWALPGVLVPLLGAHLPSEAEFTQLEEPDGAQPAVDKP
ncbi:MAG: lysylphosphatidylglycerol synthase transmembrane domain-containing protein [Phycisphaerae bacterium]